RSRGNAHRRGRGGCAPVRRRNRRRAFVGSRRYGGPGIRGGGFLGGRRGGHGGRVGVDERGGVGVGGGVGPRDRPGGVEVDVDAGVDQPHRGRAHRGAEVGRASCRGG